MLRLLQILIEWEWPVRLFAPLIGRFNPFLPEFRQDPYPRYQALRTASPVYFSPSLRSWVLSRYDDITAVLQDARFSVDRSEVKVFRKVMGLRPGDPFTEVVTRLLLMIDPPDHTRLRRLVSKAFTPRVVLGLRPRIEEIVDDLLDRLPDGRAVDLIGDFAFPLPVIVIAEMLGVPAEDRAQLKIWSDRIASILDPLQAQGGIEPARTACKELGEYLRPIFTDRRQHPKDDLISALVAVKEDRDVLSEVELLSLCILILAAGNETTTNLIGNAVLALLRNPEERRRLQEDPSLIDSAVEEFLRYDSPIQLTDRIALEDCEIAGHPIRKGQIVGLLLAAGNRDPERFAEPDRLDLGRRENHHLAFGHGIHFCLGASLARVETQIALPKLLGRFPKLDADPQQRHWKRSIVLRGLESLPVSLEG